MTHPHRAPAGSHCDHQPIIDALRAALNRVLLGKAEVVESVVTCLLAQGHILFDDLPGLGKTTIAKALAQAVGGRFARVQCTPDLLPTDITGFNMFNQQSREFEFVEGPVFSHVLLADEINRTTPRTQSALFEAMAERQVTIDNRSRKLPDTFFVIATQNPVESHGAYPLPEAQLDRFAMRLRIGYPDRASEMELLEVHSGGTRREVRTEAILDPQRLAEIQRHVAELEVHESVRGYLVDLATITRNHPAIPLGLSPRGLLIWQRTAQARAHLHGREFVIPDDVQAVAPLVLSVRIASGPGSESIVREILSKVAVPVGRRS